MLDESLIRTAVGTKVPVGKSIRKSRCLIGNSAAVGRSQIDPIWSTMSRRKILEFLIDH